MASRHSETSGHAPLSVLIVEPGVEELVRVAAALSRVGFHVTTTETFAQARAWLSIAQPSVLITTVRLGSYNGLHLVLRGSATDPALAALVTSPTEDAVLRADAEAMGATFLVKPVSEADLLAALLRTVYQRDRRPIQPPFERRARERRTEAAVCSEERRLADRRRDLLALVRGSSAGR